MDAEAVTGPVTWDVNLVQRFMLVFGPISSILEFVTFYAMLRLFGGDEALFQTGWFVESMVTQVLVVFCIRTRRVVFRRNDTAPAAIRVVFWGALAMGVTAAIGAIFGTHGRFGGRRWALIVYCWFGPPSSTDAVGRSTRPHRLRSRPHLSHSLR